MDLRGPYRFKVTYDPTEKQILCERGRNKFSDPLTSKKPKIYVFSRGGKPIYVGATIQSMSTRLRLGWSADGTGGFYGYRFRKQGSEVDLDVWVDFDAVTPRPEDEKSGSDIETIEAEIVYLLRHRTGEWPAFQTEIHFYQSGDDHRREAEKVVSYYGI